MTAENLARNWWILIVRGILAILFGLAAFLWPGITFLVLVLFFGAYAFVDGLFAVVSGLSHMGDSRRWWVFVLEGLAGMAVGILTYIWPQAASLALLYVIASWAIVTGVLEIVAAIRLRREIQNEWLLALGGAASIIMGLILVVQPAVGGLALIWAMGGYALFFGLMLILLGFRLKSWNSGPRDRGNRTFQPL